MTGRAAGTLFRKTLRLLRRPTPFKAGLGCILLAGLLYLSFGADKPALLTALDSQITSAMFRWRGPQPADPGVVIVDIDERSLKRVGQWPWPRHQVAALVEAIRAQGARVIGLDVLFIEPDRTAPGWVLKQLPESRVAAETVSLLRKWAADPASDYDRLLGQALAETPSVLGYAMILQRDGLENQHQRPFPSATLLLQPTALNFDQLNLRSAYRATPILPAIAMASSEGFVNVFPARSGAILKVPLLIALDGIPYPSLTLEMVRIGLKETNLTLHAAASGPAGHRGLVGVSIGQQFIPTDDRGELTVNFRGLYRSYPYIPAADLLAGQHFPEIDGAYVLLGTSASGLLDLQTTPFSNSFPGVEIHANVIDNLLHGNPLEHDIFTEIGITFSLIILGGLLLTSILAYGRPLPGAGAALLLIGLTIAGSYRFLFLNGTVIGLTFPLTTIIAIWLVVTLANLLLVDQQKRFIQGAFRHYLAPQVISQLLQHPEELSLVGQEMELSVMFGDIRDFTGLSERMDTAELAAFMNRYLSEMSRVITNEQGMIDKFIGDAVMAIWGAPLEDSDHPLHAVSAALMMQERVALLAPEWQAMGLPEIRIGIGINTGAMRVGNFGSEELFDYTVVGDQVNLASRIEGLNKIYGTTILISGSTRNAVCDRIPCRRIDLVRVKGKELQVELYEPLGFDMKPETEIRQWEAALDLYRQRQFSQAQHLIQQLEDASPHPLYRLYLERIAQFRRTPPPPEWDGCFIHLRK